MGSVFATQVVAVNSWQISTRVSTLPSSPEKTPIVCVHGLGVSHRYLLPTAERLAAQRQVYLPDLPGFGSSTHPPHALSIEELARALLGWMDALSLRRVVLLGNSLGCQVIAHVALAHPERVEATVLIGPTMDPDAGAWGQVARLLQDTFVEPPSYLPLLLWDYLRAGPRRTIATFRQGLADATFRRYPALSIPTLVVRGERDPIAPQKWAQHLASSLPNGVLAVVPGAGHATNYNSPDVLVELVQRFLDHIEAPAVPFSAR